MLEAAIVDALDSDEDSGDEVEDLRRCQRDTSSCWHVLTHEC
jgi:hypothetical protein